MINKRIIAACSAVTAAALLGGCDWIVKMTPEEYAESFDTAIRATSVISEVQTDISSGSSAFEIDTDSSKNTTSDTEKTQEGSTIDKEKSSGDKAWFNDAVIVGDSITVGLEAYVNANDGVLGNVKFVCSESLSYGNAQWDLSDPNAVHPTYDGQLVLAENCAVVTGSSKVIVALGINDIAVYGVETAIENVRSFIKRMQIASPNADIYLETVSPIFAASQSDNLNNTDINEFNSKLKVLSTELKCGFLNSHDIFTADDGGLQYDYCSDAYVMGIHFTETACEKWIQFLIDSEK